MWKEFLCQIAFGVCDIAQQILCTCAMFVQRLADSANHNDNNKCGGEGALGLPVPAAVTPEVMAEVRAVTAGLNVSRDSPQLSGTAESEDTLEEQGIGKM